MHISSSSQGFDSGFLGWNQAYEFSTRSPHNCFVPNIGINCWRISSCLHFFRRCTIKNDWALSFIWKTFFLTCMFHILVFFKSSDTSFNLTPFRFKSVGNMPLKKTTKKLYFPYEVWTLVNKESINITLLRSLLDHITIDFFKL